MGGEHALGAPERRINRAASAGAVHRPAGDDGGPSADGRAVHARPGSEPLDRAVPAHPGHMDMGRIDRGGHDHADVVGCVHGAHLEVVAGQRLAVRAQPAGPAPVLHGHETPAGETGHARHQLHPSVVGDTPQEPATPRFRVSLQYAQLALVAGLHREQQSLVAPSHGREVLPAAFVPSHIQGVGSIAGHVEDGQAHPGVGLARRWVGDAGRLRVRRRGIGDPPAGHRRGVHPGREQAATVGRPPVAPGTAHLLGCHELRRAPADRRRGLLDHRLVVAVAGHPQTRPDHVRHPEPVGRQPGVERARLRLQRLGCPVPSHETHPPQPSAQRERGSRQRRIGGVGHDAPSRLPHPFTSGPLGRGNGAAPVVGVGAVTSVPALEPAWISHQAFDAGGHVEHPQGIDGVDRARRSQERHAGAVVGDPDVPRLAQREAPGQGLAPREGVRLGHERSSGASPRAAR